MYERVTHIIKTINKPRIKDPDPKMNCIDPLAFPTLDPGRSTRDRGTRQRPRTLQLWSGGILVGINAETLQVKKVDNRDYTLKYIYYILKA
jgi:hypothetical protein